MIRILGSALFALSFGLHAQPAYLPLEIGNRWELTSNGQRMTLEVVGRAGSAYRVQWQNPWVRTEFHFTLSGNQVMLAGLDMGNGVAPMPAGTVYFDFDLREGGNWPNALGVMTVLSRNRDVSAPAGQYRNCIEIRATDKKKFSTYWTFAPGVGFVRFGQGSGAFVLSAFTNGSGAHAPAAQTPRRPAAPQGATVSRPLYVSLDSNPPPNEGYSADSIRNRFRMAVEAGVTYTSFLPKWDEIETSPSRYRFDDVERRVSMAEQFDLPISLNVRVVDGNNRSMPSRYKGWRFDDRQMAAKLGDLLRAIGPRFRGRVKWISLGNEVDHYFNGHRSEIGEYGRLLANVMSVVREQFPGARFTVNFSEQRLSDLGGLYRPITSMMEFYSFNYYPINSDFTVRDPGVVPGEMNAMIRAAGDAPVMFQELGYPSAQLLGSSPEKQAHFVQAACQVLRDNRGRVFAATFNWMSDLPQSVVDQLGGYYKMSNSEKFKSFLGTLGMFDQGGRPKPAWQQLQRELKGL